MINVDTDIDIDVADREHALRNLPHVPAMQIDKFGNKSRHNVGVYFQNAPSDPISGNCSFDYKSAKTLGYFKIDFLPNNIYESVQSEEHLDELMTREPEWSLLEFEEVVEKLNHVSGHFDVIERIQPRSIEDLAVVIALVRPGKAHLINRSREEIDAEIWRHTEAYYYKRPHAIAYAASIAVQLNLATDAMSAALDAQKSEGGDAI